MLVIARAAVPPFDSVTVCPALVDPTCWRVKVSVDGLSEACGVVAGCVELESEPEQPPTTRQQARITRPPASMTWSQRRIYRDLKG